MDKFNEFYMLQTKAKDLERKGQEDKALEIYLDIIENYRPNNDFSFERATTILEKKHRLDEAFIICNKAIELIENEDITGSKDNFNHKSKRILTKLESSGKTNKKKEKEDFKFTIPGFKNHNRVHMIIGSFYYLGTLAFCLPNKYFRYLFFVSLIFAIDYFWQTLEKMSQKKPFLKTSLVFIVSAIISVTIGVAIFSGSVDKTTINMESSSSEVEAVESGGDSNSDEDEDIDLEKEPPEIPERYLDIIIASGNLNHEVDNTFLLLEDRVLYFDLVFEPGTSEKNVKRIAEDLVFELGGLMVSEGLDGPNNKSFGEVYQYYSVAITISTDFEDNYITGVLNKKDVKITWAEN